MGKTCDGLIEVISSIPSLKELAKCTHAGFYLYKVCVILVFFLNMHSVEKCHFAISDLEPLVDTWNGMSIHQKSNEIK